MRSLGVIASSFNSVTPSRVRATYVDRLPLGVELTGGPPHFGRAHAAVLASSERHVQFAPRRGPIDPHTSDICIFRESKRMIEIARKDARTKPIGGCVRELNGLFVVFRL